MKVKDLLAFFAVSYIMSCGYVLYSQEKAATPLKFSIGFITGYNRGYGFRGNFSAKNFDSGFPLQLRFGLGYTFLNPGNAAEARRIFVNNATNGTPEKKGHAIDYRLDFMLPRTIFNVENSYLVFGPRFSTFSDDFKYVGGNEDFEVRSHQCGVGA